MRTADMIKSKYWRAKDLEGQPQQTLTIAEVTEELVGGRGHKDIKCFLWFQESHKGLQLNKSRVNILEAAYGPDSEAWIGKRVRLWFDPTVEFGGRPVGGVGVKTPPGVVYQPTAGANAAWDSGPVPGNGAARPPQPVWDDKRQMWITPQPPPRAAPAQSNRPPPPVWNEAAQKWEFIDASTGEIGGQMPPGRGLAALAGREPATPAHDEFAEPAAKRAPGEDFDDDIPF